MIDYFLLHPCWIFLALLTGFVLGYVTSIILIGTDETDNLREQCWECQRHNDFWGVTKAIIEPECEVGLKECPSCHSTFTKKLSGCPFCHRSFCD